MDGDITPWLPLSSDSPSSSTSRSTNSEIPELIFHTMLLFEDLSKDGSADDRKMYPLDAHADLPTAKAFARDALRTLGYQPSDFEFYHVRGNDADAVESHMEDPLFTDGILVHARRAGSHDFFVKVIPTFNIEGLPTDPNNRSDLKLPQGTDCLHYVIQTKINYNADRSGCEQQFDLEGVFVHRRDAYVAAKHCLLGDPFEKEDFVEYDDRDDGFLEGEWPYGEDVVVHAVLPTGENLKVSVSTTLQTQELHGKKSN
ncbi:hypothetical protein CC79DRAFT_1363689 [Sarocladium strictum]